MRAMLVLMGMVLCWAPLAHANDDGGGKNAAAAPAPDLKDILIVDKPGAQLPKALSFVDHRGESVTLGSYLDGVRPVVVVLAYYSCPNLCTLVLNGLTDGMRGLRYAPGVDFTVLTVSVDPRDDAALASAKRDNHLKALGRAVPGNGWDFLVSHDGGVRTLADAVGFGYRWEETSREYAHAAGIFVFTPEGKLFQTLHGATFRPLDLRVALTQAAGGTVGSMLDRLLAWCFTYDPLVRAYEIAVGRVVLLTGVPGAVLLLLAARRALRRAARQPAAPAPAR